MDMVQFGVQQWIVQRHSSITDEVFNDKGIQDRILQAMQPVVTMMSRIQGVPDTDVEGLRAQVIAKVRKEVGENLAQCAAFDEETATELLEMSLGMIGVPEKDIKAVLAEMREAGQKPAQVIRILAEQVSQHGEASLTEQTYRAAVRSVFPAEADYRRQVELQAGIGKRMQERTIQYTLAMMMDEKQAAAAAGVMVKATGEVTEVLLPALQARHAKDIYGSDGA